MQQLKKQQDKKEQWRHRGHGEYQFLTNEKEFFAAMKGEDKMVCHFFRSSLPCKVIDKHVEKLCKSHLECKFAKVRLDARKRHGSRMLHAWTAVFLIATPQGRSLRRQRAGAG